MGAAFKRGELTEDELELAQRGACPTCGACQFMGSAATGQVLSEALGLALPGSALVPQPLTKLLRYARAAGKQILRLIAVDLTPRRILTREAFENAIVIHAAIGGSTNALLHVPAIAQEAGVEVTVDDFDRIHRQVPVLANVKSTGRYPVEYFWYAGGVPALMLELRDMLHLEEESRDTVGNAYFTMKRWLEPNDWTSIRVVTSDFHIPRASWVFQKILGLGYDVAFSAAPTELDHTSVAFHAREESDILTFLTQWMGHIADGDPIAIEDLIRRQHPGYAAAPLISREEIRARIDAIGRGHRTTDNAEHRGQRASEIRIAEL